MVWRHRGAPCALRLRAGGADATAGGTQRNLEKSSSGWLVGDSLTVADLAAYGRVMSFKLGKYDAIPADVVDAFPKTNGMLSLRSMRAAGCPSHTS